MYKIFKKIFLLLLILTITSCGMLSGDKFVYLGHGEDSPDYQLYYDKTQKLFVLIDKRNGCFQKDDTGTCAAFTLKQAREFREKILAKMINIDLRLAKDDYGSYAIAELQKAGITTVNKPIKTDPVFATPIRQIVLDRKQQYHLVRREYQIDSNLVAMVTTNEDGQKRIKVAYTIDFPGVEKNYNIDLRPFIIDPEYLYTHMTMDAVHEAQFMQKDVLKSQKNVKEEVDNYLKNVVDKTPQIKDNPQQNIANNVAALDSDLITKADEQDVEDNSKVDADNHSSSDLLTDALNPSTKKKKDPAKQEAEDQDPTMLNKNTLGSDNH